VKIGLITPLTGDVKTYGESVKNAFNIAVEEYGKKGSTRSRQPWRTTGTTRRRAPTRP
jgi:ABC-type branched-subunit amino acid transport system substrate-binding protein